MSMGKKSSGVDTDFIFTTKDGTLFELNLAKQIRLCQEARSEDVVNFQSLYDRYVSCVKALEILMSPITHYRPWVDNKYQKKNKYLRAKLKIIKMDGKDGISNLKEVDAWFSLLMFYTRDANLLPKPKVDLDVEL